jgi:hypothetical protein
MTSSLNERTDCHLAKSVQMLLQSASAPSSSSMLNKALIETTPKRRPPPLSVINQKKRQSSKQPVQRPFSSTPQSFRQHNSPNRRSHTQSRDSASPTYAGAKFSESPAPADLPPPPVTWLLGAPASSPAATGHKIAFTPIRIHPSLLLTAAASS